MTDNQRAEPLYSVIRKIRKPAALRELMAACLRSIYMGDAFGGDTTAIPKTPTVLLENVLVSQEWIENIRCAIYRPVDLNSDTAAPLVMYMHGGGFVVGCSEDTDYITRKICLDNNVVVVSVNYSLAPEAVFPQALNDCVRVFDAILANAKQYNINPECVFFAGDSAGANLATSLCGRQFIADRAIRGLVLLAPWLDMAVEQYDSYNTLASTGLVYDAAFIAFARASYVRFESWKDPAVSPLYMAPSKFPPTLVLVGTEDPLVDQARKFSERFSETNCTQLEIMIYQDMPHCFYLFPSLFSEEVDCFKRIATFIRQCSK